jgi:hypothetical protein
LSLKFSSHTAVLAAVNRASALLLACTSILAAALLISIF